MLGGTGSVGERVYVGDWNTFRLAIHPHTCRHNVYKRATTSVQPGSSLAQIAKQTSRCWYSVAERAFIHFQAIKQRLCNPFGLSQPPFLMTKFDATSISTESHFTHCYWNHPDPCCYLLVLHPVFRLDRRYHHHHQT